MGDGTESAHEQVLTSMIRDNLSKNNELNRMKSLMRGKVLEVIRNGDKSPLNPPPTKAQKPFHLLNNMIMEYLQWFGFEYTSNMFQAENGAPIVPNRSQIKAKLPNPESIQEDLPVLLDCYIKNMMDPTK